MRRHHDSRRAPRGVTIVFVAVTIAMLLSFLALAINVGHLMLARGQLQNAADSGALAGVKDIGGDGIAAVRASLATARGTAAAYSGLHVTDKETAMSAPEVCLGHWDLAARTFDCLSTSAGGDAALSDAQVYSVNAIRALGARDSTQTGGPVTVYLSALLGNRQTVDVSAAATAARFGTCNISGAGACPIAFAACQIRANMLPCGVQTLLMSNSTVDDMGLTVFSLHTQANGPTLRDYLGSPPSCRSSIGVADPPDVGQVIKIQNGNALQRGQSAVSIFSSLSCLVNRTCDAAVADVSCRGFDAQFSANGDTILGFVRITVLAIDQVNKTITIRRECDSVEDVPPEDRQCEDFGLLTTRAYLVR